MKLHNYKSSPLLFSLIFSFLLVTFTDLNGQTPLPLNHVEKPLAGLPSSLATLGTAMIESPVAGTTLSAIVFSDYNGVKLHLELGDGIATLALPVAGGIWAGADVAIGDDVSNPGSRYFVNVVYRPYDISNNVYNYYYAIYEVEVTPSSITLVNTTGPTQFVSNVPNVSHLSLRIDAVPDPTVLIGGLPAITAMMVTYTNFFAQTEIHRKNVTSFATFSFFEFNGGSAFPNFKGRDIAGLVSVGSTSSPQHAVVVGFDGSDLWVHELDMSGFIGVLVNSTMLSSPATSFLNPRIEAQGMYNAVASSTSKWGVVVNEWPSYIRFYSDLNPAGFISNPTMGGTHEYPTIAAGIGKMVWLPNNYGNSQYSYAWGGITAGNYYAQAANLLGNQINPATCHTVNNTSCSMASDPYDLVSMSHSCNSGNGRIIVWNKGYQLMYKILLNPVYDFMPYDETSTARLTIYPNPAQEYIHVSGPEDLLELRVYNALGIEVAYARFENGTCRLDIAALATGNYFVAARDAKGKAQRSSFVKY